MFHRLPLAVCLVICVVAQARAQEPKLGRYSSTFTDRSPHSAIAEQAARFGMSLDKLNASEYEKDYSLPNESFEVQVPDSYKPNDGWGLFVWVNPGPSGQPRENWMPILEKHKLIWVGPNKVPNDRPVWCRAGLALDAAHNLARQYSLNSNRIYISGFSGGGRIASMLGVAYPDVFSGGLYIGGTQFYRVMPVPSDQGKYYKTFATAPPAKYFTLTKQKTRHVLLTGETDPSREQTLTYHKDGFKKDGFKHVTYIEVPGVGHQPPNSEWFEKGLLAMETPAAEQPVVVKPVAPVPAPAKEAPAISDAGRFLNRAKLYLDNNRPDEARIRLEKLLQDYPNSPEAKEAKKLLAEINKQK